MAYSCVKVMFEIGHEASIRNKRTPEGFTHDWEVFVRGADNSDIFHFVEKVVFHLHETFPKPKRVVKDPPYSVKESGYAGFTFPIEIYFKNSDEPKKVRFNYDLHLQTTGPPISKVLREQCVFPNPAEDLRRRLIKGGGVGVLGSEPSFHLASSEKLLTPIDDSHTHKHSTPALVGKPKLSSSDPSKKHKVKDGKGDESRVSNSFHDLFGPPIKTAKVSPDPKKSSHSSPKVSPVSKPLKPTEKPGNDKPEKSSKSSKHGSQKEGKESSDRSGSSSSSTKEEKKDKEKNRDKEKNKDKASKRPSTPVKPPSTPPKRPSSPPKRPPSPPKRPSSPSKLLAPPPPSKVSSSPKHASTPKPMKDEPKKSSDENKSKSESKSSENSKSEKKKKDKKNRDEKPKKDKHKEHEKGSEKPSKTEKSKDSKEKDVSKKSEKEVPKEPEKVREKEKEKSKHNDGDKEKQRHKHKKKDKSNKDKDRDKDRDREKNSKKNVENKIANEVRDKDKNGLTNESSRGTTDTPNDVVATNKKLAASSPSPSPVRAVTSPLKPSTPEKSVNTAPIKEKHKRPLLLSDDSSDSNSSASSVDEDIEPPVSRVKSIKTPESGHVPVESKASVPVTEPPRPNSRSEILKPKSENSSQERNSLNKTSSKQKEKSSKKNKERESGDGDKPEKDSKKSKRKRSKIIEDVDCARNNGEAATKIPKLDVESEELPLEREQLEEKPAVEDVEIKEESEQEEPPPPSTHLTEEYVSQLRELQHKIMTLEDNAELQRVVQVIAETGQYEITKKTFDFDLCALDRSTVKRLQEFFAPS